MKEKDNYCVIPAYKFLSDLLYGSIQNMFHRPCTARTSTLIGCIHQMFWKYSTEVSILYSLADGRLRVKDFFYAYWEKRKGKLILRNVSNVIDNNLRMWSVSELLESLHFRCAYRKTAIVLQTTRYVLRMLFMVFRTLFMVFWTSNMVCPEPSVSELFESLHFGCTYRKTAMVLKNSRCVLRTLFLWYFDLPMGYDMNLLRDNSSTQTHSSIIRLR